MRTHTTVGAILLATTTLAVAQARPDFSGTWTLDPSASDLGRPGGGPAGAGPRIVSAPTEAKLVIKQTPTELVIERQIEGSAQVSTFKLDGSESVNTGPRGGQIKSKARWDGSTLVVESLQAMNTPAGDMTLETTEVRSLAADGTMVVERTTRTPRGTRTQKLVFRKAT